MPTDSFWERINYLNHFGYLDDRQGVRPHGLLPGDVITLKHSSIMDAYLKCLEKLAAPLSPAEILIQERFADRSAPERLCIVLERHSDVSCTVCYMTTFGRTPEADEIGTAVGRLFALSVHGSPVLWPPDAAPLKIHRWPSKKVSFVFAIPVLRRLESPNVPVIARLQTGEVARLKEFMLSRLRMFKQHGLEFREATTKWSFRRGHAWNFGQRKLRTHPNEMPAAFASANSTDSQHTPQFDTLLNLPGHEHTQIEASHFLSQATRNELRRRVHVPYPLRHTSNIAWALRHMRSDLFHASSYLDSHYPAVVATQKSLPPPYYCTHLRPTYEIVKRLANSIAR